MNNNIWQLQDAKSKFSQLVENAMHNTPQIVTKHGSNAVVILSFEEYKKITKPKQDLVSFFRCSPFLDTEIEITRSKDIPRDIEL